MTLGIYAQAIASKTDHGAALDSLVGNGAERVLVEDYKVIQHEYESHDH
jgi:hypothetical protein